jgi:iron complex outermembrane recepter protein
VLDDSLSGLFDAIAPVRSRRACSASASQQRNVKKAATLMKANTTRRIRRWRRSAGGASTALLLASRAALAQPAPATPPPPPAAEPEAPTPPADAGAASPAAAEPPAASPAPAASAAPATSAPAGAAPAGTAPAGAPAEPVAEPSDAELLAAEDLAEVVVVVGSRTPRTRTETPVAVDVITAEEIRRVGPSETGRILAALAPSFISAPQTIADGSDHVDPASLRGLGPDQVLVLVNGKRRHRSALLHINGTFGRGTVGTDLNAIPSASIKRIEILRDGAASQYGSDAIAGVINIVTKDSTGLLDVNGRAGITGEGDGERLEASANYGVAIGERGFINLTAQFLQREPTNRSGTYTGTIYSDDVAVDEMMLAASGLDRDDFEMKIGEARATVGMAAYNLELPIGEHATFYSSGDLSYRFGRAAGFYRFPKQTSQVVPEYFPNGFLPRIHTTINDAAVTVGLRSEQAGWNLDLSLTHGSNAFRFNVEDSVNASLGTDSPTTFDAGSLRFSQTLGDVDLRRDIEVPALKRLTYVVGSEFRVENYQIGAGDEPSYSDGGATYGDPPQPKVPGAQVFPGFQPSNEVDRSRNNIGVYTGFESELLEGLIFDIGGRYERYSDFGNALSGKAAARAEIVPGVALRAAASNGFRAPSLQQEWFSNVSTLFLPDAAGVLEPTQVLTSNNESPVTRRFGIAPLKQEESVNLSGGVVLHPLDNLSLTADAYYIRIQDRIVLTSQFPSSNPAVASLLAPFPSVSQAQFFANAVDTKTRGLDLVADYNLRLAPGTLTLTASANFTKTDVTDVNVPASLQAAFAGSDPTALETYYFGRAARNRLEDAVPRQRGSASVNYVQGPLSALVRANFYGAVSYKPDLPDNDEKFGAKTLFDADLGYQLTDALRLGIGAENIFNTFPDENRKPANQSSGRFIYNRNVSQFGWNGGFYYARVRLTAF